MAATYVLQAQDLTHLISVTVTANDPAAGQIAVNTHSVLRLAAGQRTGDGSALTRAVANAKIITGEKDRRSV